MVAAVGQPAPDFKTVDHKREAVSLEGLRGKRVVLAFFPAAFTGVCEKELCKFRDALASFNDLDAEVLGVSVDAPFANAAFAEKNGVNFKILSDYSRDMVNNYGVAHEDFAGMPGYTAAKRSVFVINKEGNVTWSWIADNPGQEPDYEAVKKATSEA
ncbi:MAG: redoxin domain-containing protein [Deltaproteobacteria bacterium]|jgi:peroxiredoxin